MSTRTRRTEVCILGAGPHGLAAAVHLREARRDIDLVVLDHREHWLATWHDQFARAQIATLRSPIVHHPSPDAGALMRYATEHRLSRSGLQYDLPTTETFASFCASLVEGAGLPDPLPNQPHAVRSDGARVRVETADETIEADHLVVATNPHRRAIPNWTWDLVGHRPGLVEFGLDVDLRAVPALCGQRVTVIGGGLTAAHLACGAVQAGATVDLISRRPLQIRGFDTDPGWLGPKHLKDYRMVDDPARRLEICRKARDGGSIPPWMRDRLEEHASAGAVRMHEAVPVRSAELRPSGEARLALDNGGHVDAHHIWLATGTQPDIGSLRCLRPLLADVPTLDGLPVIDARLRLGPHPISVMGRLATLPLGPAAGNLWGAQRAARRITRTITGVDLDTDTIASVPAPAGRD